MKNILEKFKQEKPVTIHDLQVEIKQIREQIKQIESSFEYRLSALERQSREEDETSSSTQEETKG